LESALFGICRAAAGYSCVLNGRFTGGYITRHYGDPEGGVHAVQLELAQATYMDENPPYAYDAPRAERLRPTLRRLLETMRDWAGPG
jgi:formiminoglutamase